ncbi:winged helix-turn-helix transcriptional regulator [Salinarimonas sp.]|uniref:winged helix-turn-helix transcriptional regulator n=1 Tax=Salinarimonas sp. TaxID=2766526 RepID=UPI003919F083
MDARPALPDCPVERALALLTGKWRLFVLFRLGQAPMRFNALQRSLPPITQRVLTATLRGLEADGLVWRTVEETVPPKVTYGLTEAGAALAPVFEALAAWRLATAGAPMETMR